MGDLEVLAVFFSVFVAVFFSVSVIVFFCICGCIFSVSVIY